MTKLGTISVNNLGLMDVLDEDNLVSDKTLAVPTQQSVKAYMDALDSAMTTYVDTAVDAQKIYLRGEIANISAAASTWITSPVAGDITAITTVIDGAITGGDAAITFEIATVAVTNGGITIANAGSAAGDVDTSAPTAARTVTAGQAIEILTDGGSTDASMAVVTIEITPASASPKKVYLTGEIADISTGASSWVTTPVAGTISKIWTVIDGAIITVDAGITFEIGGTAVTGGGITIAFSGSAAGTVDSTVPTALNIVTANSAIEIITNGLSTNTVKAVVLLEITV